MKNKTKQLKEKITSPNKQHFDDQDDDYRDYDRRRRSGRPRGGDYEEETYERRVHGDRAKSAGRDPYGRGGRGLERDDRRRTYHVVCQVLIVSDMLQVVGTIPVPNQAPQGHRNLSIETGASRSENRPWLYLELVELPSMSGSGTVTVIGITIETEGVTANTLTAVSVQEPSHETPIVETTIEATAARAPETHKIREIAMYQLVTSTMETAEMVAVITTVL